jgi:hypothetical protein
MNKKLRTCANGSSTFNRGRLKKTGTLAQSGYENNEPETQEPTGSMLPK